MLNKMYLIHGTDFSTFQTILDSGFLLKTNEVQNRKKYTTPYYFELEKNISNDPYKILKGQRLTYLDEFNATFFKISLKNDIQNIFSDCLFILEFDILEKYHFIFNTEVNKGFLIDEEGKINKSKLTGNRGISVKSYPYFLKTIKNFKFNWERSEVAVRDKINIEDVRYIIIKKQYYTEEIIKKCLEYNIMAFVSY